MPARSTPKVPSCGLLEPIEPGSSVRHAPSRWARNRTAGIGTERFMVSVPRWTSAIERVLVDPMEAAPGEQVVVRRGREGRLQSGALEAQLVVRDGPLEGLAQEGARAGRARLEDHVAGREGGRRRDLGAADQRDRT